MKKQQKRKIKIVSLLGESIFILGTLIIILVLISYLAPIINYQFNYPNCVNASGWSGC